MVQKIKRFLPILCCMALILAMLPPLPASAAALSDHVTQTSGDGYSLYNGHLLPNIDTVWTDKETYPYAYLGVSFFNDNVLLLYFTAEPLLFSSDTISVSGSSDCLVFADSSGSWMSVGGMQFWSSIPFWCSSDIWATPSNEVYLSASDPIPLDGMIVIEWDGDTTDLTVVDDIYYRVSDTIFSTSSQPYYSVVTSADGLTVSDLEVDDMDGSGYAGLIDDQGDIVSYVANANSAFSIGGTYLAKWDDSTYTSLLAYPSTVSGTTTLPAGQYRVNTLVMTGDKVPLPDWPSDLVGVDLNFISNSTEYSKMQLMYDITNGNSIYYGDSLRAYSYGLLSDGSSAAWSDPVYSDVYIPYDQDVPVAFYDWFTSGFTCTGATPIDPEYTVTINVYSNNGMTLYDSFSVTSFTAAPTLRINFLDNGLSVTQDSNQVFNWTESRDNFSGFALRSLATVPFFLPGQHMNVGGQAASVTYDFYATYDAGYSDPEGVDFVDWLVSAVGGFTSFQLWPGLSLDNVLWVTLVIGILFWFLRITT